MSLARDIGTGAAVAVAGALAVGLLGWFLARKGKAAAAALGEAVNPTDRDNLAYRGVNALGEALTGEGGWTLGGWFYDWTHPEESAPAAPFDADSLLLRVPDSIQRRPAPGDNKAALEDFLRRAPSVPVPLDFVISPVERISGGYLP